MHFFGSDLYFGRQFYRRDLRAYLAEFEAWEGQCWGGEASVWYLFSTQAAAELRAFNPNARIIIMLREPAAMLYSLYGQFYFDGNEPLGTFAEALAAEPERREGRRLGRRTYFAQGLVYHAVARYAEQVERYFRAFGRERVHVIIYDDFAADPSAVYRETLRFLDLDPNRFAPDFKVINAAQQVRSSSIQNLLSDPWLRSAAIACRRWLPRGIFTTVQKVEGKLLQANARLAPRPPLDPALRAELQREFAPEVERLSQLLGWDLTHWSRNERSRPSAAARSAPVPAELGSPAPVGPMEAPAMV
jgi:hypothetical protein